MTSTAMHKIVTQFDILSIERVNVPFWFINWPSITTGG